MSPSLSASADDTPAVMIPPAAAPPAIMVDTSASGSTSAPAMDSMAWAFPITTHNASNSLQPLYPWPNANTLPSAFLTTTPGGSLAIDSTTPAWSSMGWTDLDALFAPDGISPPENGTLGAGSRVLFLNNDKPMRQGVSLAEIYTRVVESWLVGIPSTAREYARTRIMALNDNNNVMRKVRYAVAVAYIFLFASGPEPRDPNVKLVELACQGAGVVPPSPASTEPGAKDDATRKIRLYVDSVSTPLAADSESAKWTEDAIQELRQVLVTDQAQLSDLLWGVIDLQLVEFIRGGAAPSYNMLALGDRLVRAALGDHPPITLAQLRTPETFSLRLFALSDISRCIVQRGRRTLFNFWTDHHPAPDAPQDESPWSTYLGLPDSIVVLLAEVVNLAADLHRTSLVSIKAQAEELERALKNWKMDPLPASVTDSTATVCRTIAGQLWRLCALILLYQSVHLVGPLHPVLRQSRTDLLSLLDSIVRLPNGDLWGFIGLPAFLAGVLSVSDNDRLRAMQHLRRPGPERMWLDNIALVEKVWEETDMRGILPDWHDKMTKEGLSVAFF